MPCNKFDRWLSNNSIDSMTDDMTNHLKTCSECMHSYQTEIEINSLFENSKAVDLEKPTSFYAHKANIERKLSRKANLLPHLRKYQIGLVTSFALAIFIITLIPFSYQKTIGYDLTLEGINEDLARDSDKICDLLMQLELYEAGVDLGECNQTCNLVIFDLKDESEINTVISAFEQLSKKKVNTQVEPIHIKRTGTLLNRTSDVI